MYFGYTSVFIPIIVGGKKRGRSLARKSCTEYPVFSG
jgi:hypothetical protein